MPFMHDHSSVRKLRLCTALYWVVTILRGSLKVGRVLFVLFVIVRAVLDHNAKAEMDAIRERLRKAGW
jgi:hypothetical protein